MRKVVRDVYTHGHHPSVVRQHAKRTLENCGQFLIPFLDDSQQKVLDVGCGPGSITVGFAKRSEHVEVVGIDCEEKVLEEAKRRAEDDGVADRINFLNESVYELPLEDNSFDVVFAHQVLQHLADPVGAIKEMKRVLRPGGVIGVRESDYASMLVFPEMKAIDDWREIYTAVCRRNKAEPHAGRLLKAWFLDAGFQEKDMNLSASVVFHFSKEECENWGFAWEERALKSSFAAQALEYGLATQAKLDQISKAWRDWSQARGSCHYYINGQIIAWKPNDQH